MKFRMIDRIVSWEAWQSITGIKTVSFEEYSLKAPLGHDPGLPPTLQLESLFQLSNWLIMLSSNFTRLGRIAGSREVRFASRLKPGARMRVEVKVRRYRHDAVLCDGRAVSGSEVIGVGLGCLAVLAPLADYCDPDDLRVWYSEIYRPAPAPTAEG